jgi:Helicase C-terminal domain
VFAIERKPDLRTPNGDKMSKLLKPSDGTGRDPRPEQVVAFNEITQGLQQAQVVCENQPPGYGKSFLARSLQRVTDSCDIITSDNALIRQYKDTYPELNSVIGKDHYETEELYKEAHQKAKEGTPSIFNPLSYHFARQRKLRVPDLIVIDEAHLLVDMLTYLAAQVIPIAGTNVPENAKHEGDLISWCYARYARLQKAVFASEAPGAKILESDRLKVYKEFQSIARLKDSLDEGSQNQVFDISKAMIPVNGRRPQKCLVLTPVRVPHSLIKAVTDARKVVAVSGTMTNYDAQQLAAGRTFVYNQRPYLTPKENRPVYFDPVDSDFRKERDPQVLADKIVEIYSANPVPTLVHVTYAQQKELEQLLGNLRPLVNNTRNKADVKRRFLEFGGLWLAAGVSEGLDLPYGACEQMIIPTLMYPDRQDLFIQKRVGMTDGDFWYNLRTMQNTVQRLGRGVRAADDKCVAHILDPTFARVYNRVSHEFATLNILWTKGIPFED